MMLSTYPLVFPITGDVPPFLSMSLPLWWQTLILVRLGPFHHIHTLCQYCNPSTATSSVSVTPLLCCNFSSRYTEDLAARRFISITATIGLQVRDIFLFGEEYLSFYEMSIYYSPNGFISAVHCPKVCCLRGWGLYQGGWYSPSHLHSLPDLSFTLPVPPLPSLLPQGCTSTLIYSDDSFVPHIPGGYSGICCIYSLYLIYTVYAIYPCCPPVHKYSLLVQAMIMLCLKQIVGF